MNILITGGTGLIGRALIAKLQLENNASITVLTRNPSKASKLLGPNVAIITSLSQKVIDLQDTVINLAGEPIADKRWTSAQKEKICQSRWHITTKLVELIKASDTPPQSFVSGSAIGIYGRQQQKNIDESFTHFYQEFSNHVCYHWENIALDANKVTRVVLLRTGIVMAKEAGALAKMLLPFKLGLGGKLGSGEQIMSWIHLQDMVNAILFLVNTPDIDGPVNLTSPVPVSNEAFSKQLAKTLGRPCFFTTPAFVLELALGELSDILLFGQHVVPKTLLANGFEFEFPELQTALLNLLHD